MGGIFALFPSISRTDREEFERMSRLMLEYAQGVEPGTRKVRTEGQVARSWFECGELGKDFSEDA